MFQIEKIRVAQDYSIRRAVKIMDEAGIGFIYIVDQDNKITGVVSDGDFRRAILNEISLGEPIAAIMNRKFVYLRENYTIEEAKKLFGGTAAKHIPVISNRTVVDVIMEKQLYGLEKKKTNEMIHVPVVIMAGGQGSRLDPFTRILPKPLIPIGEKTIVEIIIDKFRDYGVDHFYLSVNHKAKSIKSYFEELAPDYAITYLYEDKPLGTAGGLRQLYGTIEGAFILTNCDIIIEANYDEILKYHDQTGNDISLVASVKHYSIPYGICRIENGGSLIAIDEKPEYDFLVNTGMYIVNAEVLKHIPPNEFFHMTHLVETVKESNGKVGIYPVSDRSWIDTGEWVEYKRAVEKLSIS